jgi:succinate-semialdehyde dehydrogenase/glutarate-semialdehyde dehydrogenase
VRIANDTPYGLGSYVYTTDQEQALRVADGIEAGMVFVNVVLADGAELPFGGIKRSGSGRELGRFGADEFVNKKMIRTTAWSAGDTTGIAGSAGAGATDAH